jgi:hypothetical protein
MFTHVYACLRMFTHVYAIQPILRIFIVFAQYFTLSGAAGPGTAGAGDTRGLADRRHPDGPARPSSEDDSPAATWAGGRLSRRTTRPADDSAGGRLGRRTTRPADDSAGGRLGRQTTRSADPRPGPPPPSPRPKGGAC